MVPQEADKDGCLECVVPTLTGTMEKIVEAIKEKNDEMIHALESFVESRSSARMKASRRDQQDSTTFCKLVAKFQTEQQEICVEGLSVNLLEGLSWKQILGQCPEGEVTGSIRGTDEQEEHSKFNSRLDSSERRDSMKVKSLPEDLKTQICTTGGLEETQKTAIDDDEDVDENLEAALNDTPEPTVLEDMEPTMVDATIKEETKDSDTDMDEAVESEVQSGEDRTDQDSDEEGNQDDSLLKDLKGLKSLNARVENGRTTSLPKKKKTDAPPPRRSERQKGRTAEEVMRFESSEASETDWSESESQFEPPKRSSASKAVEVEKEASSHDQQSSDESTGNSELDCPGGDSSDDDQDARRAVLQGISRSSKASAAGAVDGTDPPKRDRKYYYTPRVRTTLSAVDSDLESDSKASPLKNPRTKRRAIIDSDDSDDEEKENRAVTKKAKRDVGKRQVTSADADKTIDDMTTDEEGDNLLSNEASETGTPTRTARQRVVQLVDTSDDEDDFKDFRQGGSGSMSSPKIKIENTERTSQLQKATPTSSKTSANNVDVITIGDSDEEEQGSQSFSGRGRRNIREILEGGSLLHETQEAENAEKERKKRLARRQAEFNAKFQVPELGRVDAASAILDFDSRTKDPLVTIDSSIVKKLKPHQAKGVRFMWDNCFESIEQYKRPGNSGGGCILAHCMGLGKTFQTVAFVHTVLAAEPLRDIKTVLIICPTSTVHNWHNEFVNWLKNCKKTIKLYKFYDVLLPQRIRALDSWRRHGGVGIISYGLFRNLVDDKEMSERMKRDSISIRQRDQILECLVDPGPDIAICDEGHLIKNFKSKLSIAVNRMKTRRRIILTGTPLQNNLLEYHTMMAFVKPNLLGTRKEFANRFSNPIRNGEHKDSTPSDVRVMKKRAHVLHKLLEPSVQRLDYSILKPYLPPKFEYAVIVHMTDVQKKLYNAYLGHIGGGDEALQRIRMGFFLADFAMLSKIWSHPFNLTRRMAKEKGKKGMRNVESVSEEESIEDGENALVPLSLRPKTKVSDEMRAMERRLGTWWLSYFNDPSNMKAMEHSSKFLILKEILINCAHIGDKVLVFSQYLYSLDLMEEFLKQMDDEAKERILDGENPDEVGRWRSDKEYFRLDGSVPSAQRQRDCERFNAKDSKAKLFLISTRAGGLGINLVGANRVVLFDASFNPANDLQGIFRVYRFGQTKPCYIYRLLAKGAMEEKVYNRQVVKLSLSGRVVDEQQIQRHFTVGELVRMYDPVDEYPEPSQRPLPPKDRLLADLLCSKKDMIATYLEHDSLLQNQTDEKLTDEERRLAWEEYENEKKGKVAFDLDVLDIDNDIFVAAGGNGFGIEDENNLTYRDPLLSITQKQILDKLKRALPHLTDKIVLKCAEKLKSEVDTMVRYANVLSENHGVIDASSRQFMQKMYDKSHRKVASHLSNPSSLVKEVSKSSGKNSSGTPVPSRQITIGSSPTPHVPRIIQTQRSSTVTSSEAQRNVDSGNSSSPEVIALPQPQFQRASAALSEASSASPRPTAGSGGVRQTFKERFGF